MTTTFNKPINKSNPKNIYCDHCEHYRKIGGKWICTNAASKHYCTHRNYWNRCKQFEWKKDGNYVEQ